ncbi:hypothetical protein ACSDR0_24595 [Streptosporangium sp. G11]
MINWTNAEAVNDSFVRAILVPLSIGVVDVPGAPGVALAGADNDLAAV